jgi:hypothetical protein
MAKVKWQMVQDLKHRQIADHLNLAVCHLPFEFALP